MVGALIGKVGKGLCKLGMHGVSWTDWQSSKAITLNHSVSALQLRDLLQRVCLQDGVCRRCGVKRSRKHHDGEGTDCIRCGEFRSANTGLWDEGSITQSRRCSKSLCKLGIHGMD